MLATCVNASASFSLELEIHGAAVCRHLLEALWNSNDETLWGVLQNLVRLRLITPDYCILVDFLVLVIILFRTEEKMLFCGSYEHTYRM